MKAQSFADEGHERADRVVHVGLTRESLAHPIAQSAGLRDAAADVRQRAAAQQLIVAMTEDEERISRIETRFALIALEPAAIGAFGQLIARPGRLPRRQEGAAFVAQARPGEKILHARV